MKTLLIICLLLITIQGNSTSGQRGETLCSIQNRKVSKFFNSIWNEARRINEETGVPMAIIMGMSALETGFCKSRRCTQDCNYFSVKRNHSYCIYNSKLDSFTDFAKVVEKSCYLNLQPVTLVDWYEALECCGYAESKQYVRKLNFIIFKYNLDKVV